MQADGFDDILDDVFQPTPPNADPWEQKKKLAEAFESHRREELECELEEDLEKLAALLTARRDAFSRDSGAAGACATAGTASVSGEGANQKGRD